jgi:uncharacterized RmlC-like cupin family protein
MERPGYIITAGTKSPSSWPKGAVKSGGAVEFAAEIGPGEMVYFAPHVPHEEINPDGGEAVEFVVVRSGDEGFFHKLDIVPAGHLQLVF